MNKCPFIMQQYYNILFNLVLAIMDTVKSEIESLLGLTAHDLEKKLDTRDQAGSLEELRDALKKQANFYREENAKMEAVLTKLQLLPHELNFQSQVELDKLTTLQEKCDSKQCSSEAIGLSHADRLRKQNNYITKVKSCIKIYNNFIEKLTKELKTAKGEFERSEKKMASFITLSKEEFRALEVKVERYEKELLKFEKKYPWVNDPQYNLRNISKKTETLNFLREEKAKLVKELEVYQNLKPDISEAMKQLATVKQEYDSMK